MQSALSHIKVLDLSRILAGPWASQTLADFGAQVIKIERPKVGDDTRSWGPPFMKDEDGNETAESAYFMAANRGKQSVCIDITSVKGQQQIRTLAEKCDVVLENFKVGGAKKYGLDYESLSKINPRLIYCSITLVQAMGGLMSVTGDKKSGPQKVGVALTDVMTGLYATVGILTAMAEREKSGLGQHIDLSLLDVTAATLANQATNYLVGDKIPTGLGNAHPNIVPYQSFETRDGHCIVAVGNDNQFVRLCEAIGMPELASQAIYSDKSGETDPYITNAIIK